MTDYNIGDENGLHLVPRTIEMIFDLDDDSFLDSIDKVLSLNDEVLNCNDDLPF